MRGVLIIGGGLAAARCAETLRAEGYEGPVAIAAAEAHAPYERPALSKQHLSGERDSGSLALREHAAWPSSGIALHLGSPVVHVDLASRQARARSGAVFPFDTLVLATGAQPRRHPALSHLPGVLHLRTLDDAVRLGGHCARGSRLAIVGAGLIGAEVASTALALGTAPILVEAAPTPLVRAFGADIGALLADRWRAAGAEVLTGARVRGARRDGDGRITALALEDGTAIACDAILVAIGAVPVTSLVGHQLAIAADGGIATDASGRTSVPGVFACGDVASWHRRATGGGIRAENWTSAAQQAAVVARAILGDGSPTTEPPLYAWSDQFGLRLQHVSTGAAWERVALEGGPDDFEARYLDREGSTVAALVANRPRAVARLRRELALVPAAA